MRRVGIQLDRAEFAAAVAESFRTVEPVSETVVQERFRKSHSYRDFRGMLRKAALHADGRVLAIGCGQGLAGRSAGYAAAVTREVYPTALIESVNYSIGGSEPAATPYEMVVTHSLLHFVFDFSPLCRFIDRSLAAGGSYIMANEPNARFWRNAQCVAELERVSAADGRRRHLLKYAEPSRYWAKLVRTVRSLQSGPDITAGVNRLLRERFGMPGELTAKEILRIVDPHLRDQSAGTYRLGSDGLDWDNLAAGPLSAFHLEAARTSGYVMRDNPARIPERWRELDTDLARQFPLDGCSFTALWRKQS